MGQCEELLFILDQDASSGENISEESIAVIVYLYYPDTVQDYVPYIKAVPQGYGIYVISSDRAVLREAETLLAGIGASYILKENRGRDVSALLIVAAPILKRYDRVCFIHDKKAHAEHLKEDTAFWIHNLWTNTLGTADYIRNVNQLFDDDRTLGLLVPPEPYGEYLMPWYGDTWAGDYEATKQLAERLGLEAEVPQAGEVAALGTVFWARTEALKKLTEYPWKYEDFPEEPLSAGGTVSHAIERIFPFVVWDAGFRAGTVMARPYAEGLLPRVQKDMRYMRSLLQKMEGLSTLHQMRCFENWERIVGDFFERNGSIYIYGAGCYGEKMYLVLKNKGIEAAGFLVTDGHRKEGMVCGKPVWEIGELEKNKGVGVVIGVSYETRPQVTETLRRHGIKEYIEIL